MSPKSCPRCGLLVDERSRYCDCGYDWADGAPTAFERFQARFRRWRRELWMWQVVWVVVLVLMMAGSCWLSTMLLSALGDL